MKGSLWGLPASDSSSQGGFSFVIWWWCLFSNAGHIVSGWVGDSDQIIQNPPQKSSEWFVCTF